MFQQNLGGPCGIQLILLSGSLRGLLSTYLPVCFAQHRRPPAPHSHQETAGQTGPTAASVKSGTRQTHPQEELCIPRQAGQRDLMNVPPKPGRCLGTGCGGQRLTAPCYGSVQEMKCPGGGCPRFPRSLPHSSRIQPLTEYFQCWGRDLQCDLGS